jgi:RHS repeat-associated protein
VLKEDGSVLQETEYYAFGLAIPKTPGSNKYTFLGKEKQPETNWIDLQARFYDPSIGRFMVINPVTDGQLEFSPYHYSFDNPIRFSDPDGKWPGEGWWNALKAYLNRPLTKDQQAVSRAYNLSLTGKDFTSQTQGQLYGAMLGVGMMYSASHGMPGATSNRRLPNRVMNRPAGKPTKAAVKTPYGPAEQSTSTAAQTALNKVNSGADLYKLGTTGRSEAAGSQFWSLENPLINSAQYAQKYGIPLQNIERADFLMVGTANSNGRFITREAPTAAGAPKNSGGGIEVVTDPNAV